MLLDSFSVALFFNFFMRHNSQLFPQLYFRRRRRKERERGNYIRELRWKDFI